MRANDAKIVRRKDAQSNAEEESRGSVDFRNNFIRENGPVMISSVLYLHILDKFTPAVVLV